MRSCIIHLSCLIRFWPPCRTTRSLVQHAAGEETARMPVLFLHIYSGWFAAIVVPMERFNKATWCLVAMYCALSAHGHLMCARYLLTVWTRGICISNFKCPARAIDVALISTLISFFFFLFCSAISTMSSTGCTRRSSAPDLVHPVGSLKVRRPRTANRPAKTPQ